MLLRQMLLPAGWALGLIGTAPNQLFEFGPAIFATVFVNGHESIVQARRQLRSNSRISLGVWAVPVMVRVSSLPMAAASPVSSAVPLTVTFPRITCSQA